MPHSAVPSKKSPKPSLPKKRDRAESVRKFMQAALEVFSEVGFDAATTKGIAQRAGLNESLIQRYFQSKAGLLEAVIRHFATPQLAVPYPAGKNLEEDIFNYLSSEYDRNTQDPAFVRVAFHSVLNNPSFMRSLESKYRMPETLLSRLKFFQDKNQIKDGVDLKTLAQMISSEAFMFGIMERSILGIGDPETHRRKFKLFARIITQGIATSKP